jgi:hypothetical protein
LVASTPWNSARRSLGGAGPPPSRFRLALGDHLLADLGDRLLADGLDLPAAALPYRHPLPQLHRGLVVGMLTLQVFFHRFSQVLPADKLPETSAPPRKLMSYAIQAEPRLAWREIMAALFVWGLHMLVTHGIFG